MSLLLELVFDLLALVSSDIYGIASFASTVFAPVLRKSSPSL
jgi:hypothetical protein